MSIPRFIPSIPAYVHTAWNKVSHVGQLAKNRVAKFIESKRNYWKETNFWKQHGKSFYARNIKPLNKMDFLLLTGSLLIASVIVLIASSVFGIGAFPLAMGAGALLVLGAWSFSRNRVRNHFNEIAWEHVNAMRKAAHQMTYTHQQFGPIHHYKGFLAQPEFEHLKEDIKQLDQELFKFRDAVTKIAPGADLTDSKKAFIEHLEALQRKLAQHKPIEKLPALDVKP